MDYSILIKRILALIFIALFSVVFGVLIGEQDFFRLVIVCAAITFILFLQYPQVLGWICIALFFSRITAPGIPGKLNLYYILASILIGIMFLKAMLGGLKKIEWSFSHSCLAGFGFIILLTMIVRGAGFRVLGSEQWGGMVYVLLYIGLAMILALTQAGINNVWMNRALVWMGVLSILPLISDIVYVAGHPEIERFIQPNADIVSSYRAVQAGVEKGVVRYHSGGVTGVFLLLALLVRVDMKRLLSFRGVWLWPLPVAFFGMVLISGHRLGVITFVLFVAVLAWIQRAFTFIRIWLFCIIAIVGWYVLVDWSPYLPEGVQRSISWMPGVDIPEYVSKDAESTTEWRLTLWTEAMKKLPDYWLIGKGYAFSGKEMVGVAGANIATAPLDWALISSSYHNGPISMLLGLGVFGLLTGVGFLVSAAIRHGRFLKKTWADPSLKRCHQVIYAIFFTYVAIFFTLFGAVEELAPFFFMFALLETVQQLDRHQSELSAARSTSS